MKHEGILTSIELAELLWEDFKERHNISLNMPMPKLDDDFSNFSETNYPQWTTEEKEANEQP